MTDITERFTSLCQDEAAILNALLETLNAEQRALIQHDVTSLVALAAKKTEQLALLDAASRTRGELMRSANLADAASLTAWLADKPDTLSAWQTLDLTLARTRAINQVNGQLMDDRLSHVEEALSVLKSAAAATVSYQRDGSQGSVMGSGRSLGSA